MGTLFKTLILIFFCSTKLIGQEYQQKLQNINLNISNNSIPEDLLLIVTQDENGFTKVSLNSASKEEASFFIKPFTVEMFMAKIKNDILKDLTTKQLNNIEKNANDQILIKLYSDIQSYFNTTNEPPHVATVTMKDNINIYTNLQFKKKKEKKRKEEYEYQDFTVSIGVLKKPKIFMTFYSGFIEKIEVHGEINGNKVKFSNNFSIGVSSQSNIENFRLVKLFSKYPLNISIEKITNKKSYQNPNNQSTINIQNKDYELTILQEKKEDIASEDYSLVEKNYNSNTLHIYLDELIDYQRLIDVNANDISPDKQKIILDEKDNDAELFREESTKILEAVVYTDLLGALNEENPNGIIQTEVSKKFNLNTARGNLTKEKGIGALEYTEARVLLSKIEEDNKYLLPDNTEFKLLDLYRYRNFSIGGLLNIFTVEEQDLKLNIFYETGVEFSRSGYKSTEESKAENLNAFEWSNTLKFHIFPEKRYGLVIKNNLLFYEILNKEDNFRTLLNKKKDWLNTIEFSAYLDIATSAKIFIRYALVHELSNFDNNFSRIQFGTSFFLLKKNRKK